MPKIEDDQKYLDLSTNTTEELLDIVSQYREESYEGGQAALRAVIKARYDGRNMGQCDIDKMDGQYNKDKSQPDAFFASYILVTRCMDEPPATRLQKASAISIYNANIVLARMEVETSKLMSGLDFDLF